MENSPREIFEAIMLSSKKIRELAPRMSRVPGVRANLFVGLLLQLSLNQRRLIDGYQNTDISLLAWGARNTLELSVWTEYAATSEKNAKRLCDEMILDGSNMVQVASKLANLVPDQPELIDKMKALRETLQPKMDAAGLEGNEAYLRFKQIVKDAYNKEVHEAFCYFHHLLSKFVHPTSYLLIGNHSNEPFPQIATPFFKLGADFSIGSVDHVEKHVLQLERPYPNS